MAATKESTNFVDFPSVCLPRIWSRFDKTYVETVFINLLGPDAENNSCIKRIDFLSRTDNRTQEPYWLVFVHFSDKMLPSQQISDFVDRINAGGLSIIYDQENYGNAWWKVRPCTAKSPQTPPYKDLTALPRGPRLMTKEEEQQISAARNTIQAEQTNKEEQPAPPLNPDHFPPLNSSS
jgi:hypothetical protein